MTSIAERIIEEIKLYPILFDLAHPEYKNFRKKNEIWDQLGKTLGAEGDDVKKKWKNLRDGYAKHIRSEKTRTGQKAKSIERYKAWPWAQQMSFFKQFLQFASTESNVSNSEDTNKQMEDDTPNLSTDLCQTLIQSPVLAPDEQTPIPVTSTGGVLPKKHRVMKSQSLQQSTSVDKVLQYLEARTSINQNSSEIDLLFMGYAKTVKRFSARRQTLVKYRIAKMLMEEEIQQQTEEEAARPTSRLLDSDFTAEEEDARPTSRPVDSAFTAGSYTPETSLESTLSDGLSNSSVFAKKKQN